jgi:hypothetical protein
LFLANFPEKSALNILQVLNDEGKTNSKDRYPTSKLLDLFLAREIAGLPKAQGVVVKYVYNRIKYLFRPVLSSVVDPGLCISELGRDMDLKPAVL